MGELELVAGAVFRIVRDECGVELPANVPAVVAALRADAALRARLAPLVYRWLWLYAAEQGVDDAADLLVEVK